MKQNYFALIISTKLVKNKLPKRLLETEREVISMRTFNALSKLMRLLKNTDKISIHVSHK